MENGVQCCVHYAERDAFCTLMIIAARGNVELLAGSSLVFFAAFSLDEPWVTVYFFKPGVPLKTCGLGFPSHALTDIRSALSALQAQPGFL